MRAKFGNGLPRPEFDEIGIGPESRVPRSVHRLVIHLFNRSNVGDPVGLAACTIFDGLLPLLYLLTLYHEKRERQAESFKRKTRRLALSSISAGLISQRSLRNARGAAELLDRQSIACKPCEKQLQKITAQTMR